jgi:iron(III) transport system substrate-binding protein
MESMELNMVAWYGRRLAALVAALFLTACSAAPAASPTAATAKPTEPPAAKPAAASPQPAAASPAAAAPAAASPGAASKPAPKTYPKPDGWDALVEAAKKEGSVVVLGPPGQTPRQAVVDEFQKAYPGIKVEFNVGRLNDLWSRIQAERATQKYLWDLGFSGNTAPILAKPVGALATLRPQLVLPEVTDESVWLDNRLWWVDSSEPRTTLDFQGNVQLIVVYNKNVVPDISQLTSYRDLLDPKWKSKMVSTDLRNSVVGGVPARFIYNTQELGAPFLEQLYAQQDIQISADQTQLVDWVASGQFAFGLFLSPQNVAVAIEQGLPIGYVPADQFKEGSVIGPSTGTISIFEPAAHPNAAKLLANWLLSRDGQVAWQRIVQAPSLRIDIPKDGVFPLFVPNPGKKYVHGGAEAFGTFSDTAVQDAVDRGLRKAKGG